jgi:hypothetical protein
MESTQERLKAIVMSTIEEIENLTTFLQEDEEKANDFFDSILSISYMSDFTQGKQEYLGAELLVAYGGPNVYVDTRYNLVSGHWGFHKFEMSFNDDSFLYEHFEEQFYCNIR